MFRNKDNTSDYITRTEAESEVGRLNRRSTSLEERGLAELEDLKRRITVLEVRVAQLRNGNSERTQETALPRRPVSTDPSIHDRTGLPRNERITASARATITPVDYAAIAFGLAEIKREAGNLGAAVPPAYFPGVVQYFSDVFAKSDPQFNAAEFARLANA